MAKIMLVEDDNNLREIYEARLLAEGYEIVSARDGEEALAKAVAEKPDLIIADVMMPKISGFDMLDILRSTPETKNTKVIIMTALSQMDDKNRAERLGSDRYLVKSQVTLEDVARVAREVLEGEGTAPTTPAASADKTSADPSEPSATPTKSADSQSTVSISQPAAPTTPVSTTPQVSPVMSSTANQTGSLDTQTTAEEETTVDEQIDSFIGRTQAASPTTAPSSLSATEPSKPTGPPVIVPTETAKIDVVATPAEPASSSTLSLDPTVISPTQTAAPTPTMTGTANDAPTPGGPDRMKDENDDVPIAHKKVIQPPNDSKTKPDLTALLAKEEQMTVAQNPGVDSVIAPDSSVTTSSDAPIAATTITPSLNTTKPTDDPNAIAL